MYRCDEVRIRSYSRCSAQLSLESCSVTTHGNENESGFEIRSHSKKLVHKLERGSIYFHYNGVKVSFKLFFKGIRFFFYCSLRFC